MVKFWENAIFYTGSYTGNPMDSHKKIHHMFTFSETDFERWLLIFNSSVDELFKGVNALLIKQKAHSISTVMKLKLIGKKEETNL
jgi:hemoglobin